MIICVNICSLPVAQTNPNAALQIMVANTETEVVVLSEHSDKFVLASAQLTCVSVVKLKKKN